MGNAQLVLIVDDDPHIREVVRFALEKAGYGTISASDGREAVAMFQEHEPDLIVLDILMPEMDGTEVCRILRGQSNVPIVFLSSRDEEVDRIVGLEVGGDDYVTKPFSPRELVARVKAVLRRTLAQTATVRGRETGPGEADLLVHGRLRLDLDRFQAFWDDHEIVLTVTEFGLVKTLLGFPGKVFTRDELMSGAYASDNFVTDRTIDSHLRRVRRKLAEAGANPIETVHGLGYKLGPCE